MDTLETKRLILRAFQPDDFNDFYEYAKNPKVYSELNGWEPHFVSGEKAEEFFIAYAACQEVWAIALRENEKVIGHLKLYPDENRGQYSERNSAKYITYALSENYWGKGYMTEAVKRAVKYAFSEMNVALLTVFHFPHNVRSKRVIEKCGFQYETTIERGFTNYDGKVFDSVCYSMLKSDYRDVCGTP